MRCSTFAAVFLTPLYVLAEVAFTNDAYDGITAGAPFTITWSGDGTPVIINLVDGPEDTLRVVDNVASGIEGSSYIWTPLSTQDAGLYALSILQSGVTNYSPTFQLTNNIVQSTTSSEPATSTATVTTTATPTDVQILTIHPYTPPYPTGPSNVTAPAAVSSNGAALPTDGPKAAVLPPGSSAPYIGGAKKFDVRGKSVVVGALIVGALAVRWAL